MVSTSQRMQWLCVGLFLLSAQAQAQDGATAGWGSTPGAVSAAPTSASGWPGESPAPAPKPKEEGRADKAAPVGKTIVKPSLSRVTAPAKPARSGPTKTLVKDPEIVPVGWETAPATSSTPAPALSSTPAAPAVPTPWVAQPAAGSVVPPAATAASPVAHPAGQAPATAVSAKPAAPVPPANASRQAASPGAHPAPDDTPSIKVGATLFTDYTYTQSPQQKDADGNTINFSQFNVSRSYINITGNISHIVAFRFTPDISRENGSGSSMAGSLTFRVKYAFAQFNLDDWMAKGSWVRLGIQQTPWIDFQEGIYRYRFQGTVFSEREGYQSSADAGASFHYNLPSNYGDVHVGVYNGETYSKPEVNNQKAFQVRGTVRPFATAGPALLRGLRGTVFYDADSYVKNAERMRLVGSVTFEHQYLNAGVEYLNVKDQTSVAKAKVAGSGYSFWATPRSKIGFEGLFRYDHMTPNTALNGQLHKRTILGVSYWFPHQGSVSTAILLDYDKATFPGYAPEQPDQTKIAVHGLVNF